MGIKDLFSKLSTPQREHDRVSLRAFCAELPITTHIGDLVPRAQATVAGEISSLRIVPSKSDGAPWLEATVKDGTGSLVVLWTGRRKIAGVKPGGRLMVSGRPTASDRTGRPTLYNPAYRLL